MNYSYVENLPRPDNDFELVIENAKELIQEVFPKELVEYAIDAFLEAAQTYYDDYDITKYYYILELNQKMFDLCFDIENLAHLFGIPNRKFWQKAAIINSLIQNNSFPSNKWLEVLKKMFEEHKKEIITFESDEKNESEDSLNWDKISEKLFCFLNLGIISEGETFAYRENVSRKIPAHYVLTRDVISKGVKGKIRLLLVPNGNDAVLTPKSLIFSDDDSKRIRRFKMNGKDFIFDSIATINQVRR